MRRPQSASRWRLRPARPCRLRPAGRADRQRNAGHAGEADLDARRGYDALCVSPDHAMPHDRRHRRQRQRDRAAHAHLRSVDSALARARAAREWAGQHGVPGADAERAGRPSRLQHPQRAGRPRDAQLAHPGRLLARRERQPQRDLCGVVHRRARARA